MCFSFVSCCWIASVCLSISSLCFTPFSTVPCYDDLQGPHQQDPMLSGFPLGLARESLGKRSEGRRRVRPECVFPWLLPGLGWTCPSIQDQCAFPGKLCHIVFDFGGFFLAQQQLPPLILSGPGVALLHSLLLASGCWATSLGCPTLPSSPTHTFINNPFANKLS